MEIIYAALALFGATGLMGMYLSSLAMREKPSSKPVILVHGFFTIGGFWILGAYIPESFNSILLFAAATLCGLVLLYQDLTTKNYTRWLFYAHGIITIVGFVFLLLLSLQQ